MFEQVREAVAEHRLFAPGARIVVAVSGGADSVALLHLMLRLKSVMNLSIFAAHLDHGLREDSSEDAVWVGELGRTLGVPTTVERREVASLSREKELSLEEAAREVRYAFLLETAQRLGASHVALAHTADDQAETVLMRFLRGAGLTGLSAIPVKRSLESVWIVRPLLSVWRSDILDYLKAHRLSFRHDQTNDDRRFFRNRIRHELLPLLEQGYNPNLKKGLVQLAEQSRGDDAFLQKAAGRQWKRMAKKTGSRRVMLKLASFRRQPLALRRQLMRQAIVAVQGSLRQFEFRHWLEIERLLSEKPEGSIVHLPGGIEVVRHREAVVIDSTTCDRQAAKLY